MHRYLPVAGMLVTLQLVAAAAAAAKPRLEEVKVQFGVVAELTGVGCTSASLSRSVAGTEPVSFQPAVGDDVGYVDSIVVTSATLGDGHVAWTVRPTAEECDYYKNDPSWEWSTDEMAWSVTHGTTAYAIRASRHGGNRSIAGLRVDRLTRRSAPTVRKARRRFGKPSSIRRRYGVSCRLRWNRIGLTIDFLNLGGRNPCRRGFVQAGRVTGTAASRWTAVVANHAGVAHGTSADFLDNELIGEPGESADAWTLADVFIPYGEAGYSPSLSALLNRRGAVSGFEFWVGAGGD